MKGELPKVFSANLSYDLSRTEIEEILRKYTGLPDARFDWDVSKSGVVRSVRVYVSRTEIKG